MTLEELISAIERLQAVYVELRDEQSKVKEKIPGQLVIWLTISGRSSCEV